MSGAASGRVGRARNPYQGENDWHGLYAGSTSRDDHLFTPESVAHPAKMSLPLLRRILAQMTEWGWLAPGACVVDPFGGRGTTAAVWCAMDARNRAVTFEVEPHFAAMQEANREHARRKLGRPLRWVILQGDARNADGHLARRPGFMGASICSPPYENSIHAGSGEGLKRENFADPKKVGRLVNSQARPCDYGVAGVTSPPYGNEKGGDTPAARGEGRSGRSQRASEAAGTHHLSRGYGGAPSQIGELPDPVASITSPPYAETEVMQPGSSIGRAWKNGKHARETFKQDDKGARRYGRTAGQIGALPDAAILSPPYGQGTIGKTNVERLRALTKDPASSLAGRDPNGAWFRAMENGYAPGPGNIDLLPDASVLSPPYEAPLGSDDPDKRGGLFRDPKRRNDRTLTAQYGAGVTSPPYETQAPKADGHHAVTSDEGLVRCKRDYATTGTGAQIGATQGDTYEGACLAVYSALARAGVRYLVTVTKNPTRGGKLRRLDQTTARLLRAAGYRIRGWRRAWLFETEAQRTERDGQGGLFDDVAPSGRLTGRLSFFKRLSIGKGAPAAQWEDVFFAELALD